MSTAQTLKMRRNLGRESTRLLGDKNLQAVGFRLLRYFEDRESAAALVEQLSALPDRQQFLITGKAPLFKVWHRAVEGSW
jgi:hypothetical protein